MVRKTLILINFILMSYLFFQNCTHIEILGSMNNAENIRKQDIVDRMTNIDTLKIKAKEDLQLIRKSVRQQSDDSIKHLGILSFLIIIQLILLKQATLKGNK
jgi:hypothetical protein